MTEHAPLTRDAMVQYFADGEKPRTKWGIGTEHEKLLFDCQSHRRPSYEEAGGIGAILGRIAKLDGWTPIVEQGHIIALKYSDGASITLEPGGQF